MTAVVGLVRHLPAAPHRDKSPQIRENQSKKKEVGSAATLGSCGAHDDFIQRLFAPANRVCHSDLAVGPLQQQETGALKVVVRIVGAEVAVGEVHIRLDVDVGVFLQHGAHFVIR